MATQTLTRPPQEDKDHQSSAANDKTDFDKEFSALTSDGHYSKNAKDPMDKREDLKTAEEKAAAGSTEQPGWKVGGAYGDKDENNLIGQAKKLRLSRRKKAAGGAAGGGVAIGIVITLLLGQTFKIPITIGGIHNGMPGDRTMRRIVEKRFDRILTQYLIDRAAGSTKVKEGSLMDKLYKGMDKAKIPEKVAKKNGIKYVNGPGGVRAQHLGKDIGPANDFKQAQALRKKNKAFARESKAIVTRTFPIMRLGRIGVFRWFSYRVTGIRSYSPLEHDKDKTPAQNEGKINQRMNVEAKGGAIRFFGRVLNCIMNGVTKCPTDNKTRSQPVDTTTREPISIDPDGDLPENRDAKGLEDTTQSAFDETNQDMATSKEPAKFNFMQRFIEKLVTKIVGGVSARVVLDMIPFFGWINAIAEIVHTLIELNNQDLINKMMIMLKETQYTAITSQWAGIADNTAAGKTPLPVMAMMGARLNGTGSASMSKALANKDPSTGVPVDPQVGSNLEKSEFTKLMNKYLAISQYTGLLPLTLWYHIITVPLNALSDLASSILFWGFKNSIFFQAAEIALVNEFGPNWEAKFATWAMNKLFSLFGMTLDALATGAKLYNNIAVGWDVLTNMFVQLNLGGQVVSKSVEANTVLNSLTKANQNYNEYVATLPLKDRLFSTSEPSSLFSRLLQQTPDSVDPASIIGAFTRQLAALPSTLAALLTGNAWAANVNQISAVSGVAQYDLLTTDTAEISPQVMEAGDQPCPENKPGFSNTCVADKTIVHMGQCGVDDTPEGCPELNEPVAAAALAPTTGAVSATGDSQALAKQILAMAQSPNADHSKPGVWFSTFGGAKKDLETVAAGFKITYCVPPFKPVTLDPGLLNLIIAASKSYNIGIGFFVSGHDCDQAFHPKGMAMDVNYINGSHMTDGNLALTGPINGISASLVKKFMEDIARMMPAGKGGLGQKGCTPLVNASYPSTINAFRDTCNHLHIDVEP